jgi:hypothetical protein
MRKGTSSEVWCIFTTQSVWRNSDIFWGCPLIGVTIKQFKIVTNFHIMDFLILIFTPYLLRLAI